MNDRHYISKADQLLMHISEVDTEARAEIETLTRERQIKQAEIGVIDGKLADLERTYGITSAILRQPLIEGQARRVRRKAKSDA